MTRSTGIQDKTQTRQTTRQKRAGNSKTILQPDPVHDIRQEAGIAPSTFSPGTLGREGADTAWELVRQTYLHNPLRIDERVALLCAALERPGGKASAAHATGTTLIGQDPKGHLVDLSAVWQAMLQTDRGRRLLWSTIRLGQGKEVDAKTLTQVYNDLGPLASAWQDILRFATWIDIWNRSQAPFQNASSDDRVDDWLAIVVRAQSVLPKDFVGKKVE